MQKVYQVVLVILACRTLLYIKYLISTCFSECSGPRCAFQDKNAHHYGSRTRYAIWLCDYFRNMIMQEFCQKNINWKSCCNFVQLVWVNPCKCAVPNSEAGKTIL